MLLTKKNMEGLYGNKGTIERWELGINQETGIRPMFKNGRREYMTLELLKQDCCEEGDASRQEKVVVNMLKAGMEEAVIVNIAELSIAEAQKIKKKHNL